MLFEKDKGVGGSNVYFDGWDGWMGPQKRGKKKNEKKRKNNLTVIYVQNK